MTNLKKTLDAFATFTGEKAEEVKRAKEELGLTWGELILKGIEAAKKEKTKS